jgi:hypothetical protein
VAAILGAAVVLGLSQAAPMAAPDGEADVLAQSMWGDPIPSFLTSALGVRDQTSARRGLVPTVPPHALVVPVPPDSDATTSARRGGTPVRVFFSRRPDSESAFSNVFPVTRMAGDRAVATAALASLVEGPTAGERSGGYFSELGSALKGASSCSGRNFQIGITNGTATVRFCRTVTSAGAGHDARIRSQIEATLRQFETVRAVRLIASTGRCLFDQSGQDRCLDPPTQGVPKPAARTAAR